ncbi:fibrobacter succinogenes major paralogous domain-containing protein [Draconibacterium sp.]|nr:fibrobacter succinogenes major paralogous domain-containing protein [Draconibacterium sp.]
MPILNGLSTKNKAEISINGTMLGRVYVGSVLVWQKSGSGLLYNMAAVNDYRQIAPEGYRVASIAEIDELITYLGGESLAGGKLKAVDAWTAPNTGATNETGFTALPGGYRDYLGIFAEKLLSAKIWIDNE